VPIITNIVSSNAAHGKVLVVEEAEVPGENHRPWASNWGAFNIVAARLSYVEKSY
jgi:hypothetical protein